MKILAYSLLILGFVIIALSHPSSDHQNLPMVIIGAAIIIVGSTLLARSSKDIKVTGKDKVPTEETPRGFSIWRFLVELLAGLGFLALVGGICSLFGVDSSGKIDWHGGIEGFAIAGILILPAIFIERHDRRSK